MTKKTMFIIGGSAAFCVLIIALIAVFTGGTPSVADTGTTSQTASEPTASVTVSAIDQTASTTTSTIPSDVNSNIAETEKNTSTPSAPTVKDESQLTNPNSKPSYDSKDTKVNSDSSKPKNGDKKDGMIYIEGFGWIVDEGGTASGQVMGNEGDQLSGNQVGNMG